MKKYAWILGGLFVLSIPVGCKKDFRGVCKCTYLSGDKKEFDYSHLTIAEAQKKCDTTSANASHFAGSCKME